MGGRLHPHLPACKLLIERYKKAQEVAQKNEALDPQR
jgi:hypothetical protein